MTKFLGFCLSGAMSSWGDVAVGDIRSTWSAPSASALHGLICAALGIRREDVEESPFLEGLRFAVRLDHPGTPLRDYHTVQSAQTEARAAPFKTRRDELYRDVSKRKTKLSDRSYWLGQISTVIVWGEELERIQHALRHPKFFLALGRRACPPSRPLAPLIVEAESIVQAFGVYDQESPSDEEELELKAGTALMWDARPGGPKVGIEPTSLHERRDVPISRGQDWSFLPRMVAYATWPVEEQGGVS